MLTTLSNSAFGFRYYKVAAGGGSWVGVLNPFFDTPTISSGGRTDYNTIPGFILNGDWYAESGNQWRFYNNLSTSNGACFYTYTGLDQTYTGYHQQNSSISTNILKQSMYFPVGSYVVSIKVSCRKQYYNSSQSLSVGIADDYQIGPITFTTGVTTQGWDNPSATFVITSAGTKDLQIKIQNTASNDSTMYFAELSVEPLNIDYVQFNYTMEEYGSGYTAVNGAGTYPLVVTNGTSVAFIDELRPPNGENMTMLAGKTTTLYFKSKVSQTSNDNAGLFQLSADVGTYTNTALLTMSRANSAGTNFTFVVGSGGTVYREDNVGGFPGANKWTHVFLVIKDTDELVCYVYNYLETLIYTSTTTIDSSVFGHDFNRNLFNGRTAVPSGPGRKMTMDDCGWWQKALTESECAAHVALNPN
jgi:hypothetical protein